MILVAGPPCGGKTTYVRKHAAPTDSILDFGDIAERLTGSRYIGDSNPHILAQARAEWIRRLPQSDWVIWIAPRRAQRGRLRTKHQATILVVMADIDTCLARAAEERPPEWQPLIRSWFNDWEPSRSGREHIVDTTPGRRSAATAFFA